MEKELLDSLYFELLEEFEKAMSINNNVDYSLIYPSIGLKFHETGLVICGRATNGYYNEWKIKNIIKEKKKIISMAKKDALNPWTTEQIEDYVSTKPFFRITKKILINYYKVPKESYADYFAWSNLMKIAPSKGGNPNDKEYNAQIKLAKKIFKAEIDEYNPRNIVLMSGKITDDTNWAYDFIEELGLKPKIKSSGKIIESVYNYKKTKIITMIRPEIKQKNVTEDDIYRAIKKELS